MRLRRAWTIALSVLLFPLLSACGWNDLTPEVTAAIRERVASTSAAAARADVSKDVREFYARREFAPAWIDEDEGSRSHQSVNVLETATEHGLAPADYDQQDIVRLLDAQFGEDP